MKFPTGGKAHEPKGMIRCDSEADSTVWMREDENKNRNDGSRASLILADCGGRAVYGKNSLGICVPGLFFCSAVCCRMLSGHSWRWTWLDAWEVGFLNDQDYMRMALELAAQGAGWVSPNPMVGAVIVKDGKIIGKGFHERYGQPHAERNALAACTEPPEGAVMYVTLEPCCHHGKQPPCVDAVIGAGISRVVVGSGDPNPLVAGKGIRILKEHGILVTEHVLEEDCERLNEVFFHYIQTRRPFVVMKYAMTMDGKIAAYTGASKWITGEAARRHVQQQRSRYRAIMAGVGTVLADDPLLTCRIAGGRNPVRIICDSTLRTPLTAQVVATASQAPTWIATCCTQEEKHRPYLEAGCRILVVDQAGDQKNAVNGRISLTALMERLGREEIDSVLLEGGGTLNWSALQEGIVQKVQAYLAPKLFGGEAAKTPVEGIGFASPKEAVLLGQSTVIPLDGDYLIESMVQPRRAAENRRE